MAKEPSLMLKICDYITKYSIYVSIFLIPIFFLPFTSDVLDFNKQTLLLLLGFVALFAWMLKILFTGKFEINVSKMHIVVGILLLVYLLSSIFSVNAYGSFWGWPQSSTDSFLSLIAFLLVYFLVSNVFSKKDILNSVIVLSFSAVIAQIIGVLQVSGLFVLPFDFAKSAAFSTIGSAGSLGLFSAVVLPLAIAMLILSKKWWKILFILEIILSGAILFLINYSIVWWVVVLGAALIMIFGVFKRNIFDGRWMALPMFFAAVALFFIFLNPQIPGLNQRVNEIYLNQQTSLKIDLSAIKEKPIFGSGPGTFSYDFGKFKDASFSGGSLWNVNFTQATSKILNDLAATGILGIAALLALVGFSIFLGIRFLAKEKILKADPVAEKEQAKMYLILALGIISALVAQSLAHFLYNANFVLSFIYFLLVACLINFVSEGKKSYELKSSSLTGLIIIFAFTLVFIFGMGLLILHGQRYVAEVNYYNGLSALQSNNLDEGIKSIEKAASLNSSSDLYFRQLSQLYLLKLQQELGGVLTNATDEQKNKIQALLVNAVNAGKIATDINPQSAANWAVRGYVYQSLFGLITDADKWALNAYDTALKLDPNNPYLYSQEGNVNYISALKQQDVAQKNDLLAKAQQSLEKSVSLNQNYSNGLYSLGLVYDVLGQKDKAIEQFTRVQQLNPKDTSIPKILDNLKAGLPALQSPKPLTENPLDNNKNK